MAKKNDTPQEEVITPVYSGYGAGTFKTDEDDEAQDEE